MGILLAQNVLQRRAQRLHEGRGEGRRVARGNQVRRLEHEGHPVGQGHEAPVAGRGGEFAYDKAQTDAMNAATAATGHDTSLPDARAREEVAYQRFRDAVAALDEALLDLPLGNGDTVEAVIRYDGPDPLRRACR